ncbi:MAG TPA: PEP-CTERM sorting domain-containing protein [Tepidisphaeraceae bacterium]|nr:PEP-CTERM sorting domain-containing protein [Tepidisphaeraceae bacterium]
MTSTGFGGAFHDLPALSVNAMGETMVELDVTVHSGDNPNLVVVLGDPDFSEYGYRFDELAPGNHVVTFPLLPNPQSIDGLGASFISGQGAIAGLNLGDLDFIHIQVDPHGSTQPYSVSYNNLRLTGANVPEPTTLSALAFAGMLIAQRRR